MPETSDETSDTVDATEAALATLMAAPAKFRLAAAQRLWDSFDLADEPGLAENLLSPEQWAEIDRRMAAAEADPSILIGEEEAKRRIEAIRSA